MKNRIKLLITLAIICCFVWFLILSPLITFKNNEKALTNAAKEYFEYNSGELPTGERIKTISMQMLYDKAYLKEDMYAPYTKKVCNIEDSWVKVKREDGEFKYYTYLECGVLNSTIDHKGPEIKLNGEEKITVSLGDDYKELGVSSVVDNVDGKISTSKVKISGIVNTSKVDEYEVEYIVSDSLGNISSVKRIVNVVKTLSSTVKKSLGEAKQYVGDPLNNYVIFSNEIYRIVGLDKNNDVMLVDIADISNVNYSKLDDWLDFYYKSLMPEAKKMIVEKKYCNMKLNDSTLDTIECNSYGESKKISVPSIDIINRSDAGNVNFMRPDTVSWTSNGKSDKEIYATTIPIIRDEEKIKYISYNSNYNYGVRPLITIKGDSLIKNGDGSFTNPYVFGDTPVAKNSEKLNERYIGEYIRIGDMYYRIIELNKDGAVKVISVKTLTKMKDNADLFNNLIFTSDYYNKTLTYDVKNKFTVAYLINNKSSEEIDTSLFVKHSFVTKVYKDNIIYGEDIENNKFTAKIIAPSYYDLFSAVGYKEMVDEYSSYWLNDTSKKERLQGAIDEDGVPLNKKIEPYNSFGVKVVAYIKPDILISSGDGTYNNPYILR